MHGTHTKKTQPETHADAGNSIQKHHYPQFSPKPCYPRHFGFTESGASKRFPCATNRRHYMSGGLATTIYVTVSVPLSLYLSQPLVSIAALHTAGNIEADAWCDSNSICCAIQRPFRSYCLTLFGIGR